MGSAAKRLEIVTRWIILFRKQPQSSSKVLRRIKSPLKSEAKAGISFLKIVGTAVTHFLHYKLFFEVNFEENDTSFLPWKFHLAETD